MRRRVVHIARAPANPDALQLRPVLGVWPLLKRVFSYTRPHRKTFRWLLFHVCMRAVLLPCGTWTMASVINGPIEHRDSKGILLGALGFASLALFTNCMFHFRYKLALRLGEAVIHDLRAEVFAHVLRMPMRFFDLTKVGRVIGRVSSDIESIRTGVQDVAFISIVQLGQMTVAVLLMLYQDWKLFMLLLGGAPVVWGLNHFFTKRIAAAQRRATESFSRITAALTESVSGIRVTQGFVREDLNAESFRALVEEQGRFNVHTGRVSALFLPLLEANTLLFTALLLLFGSWRVLSPETHLPVGHIVQFFFLATLLFDPIRNISAQYTAALNAMVGAERVFQLLDTPPEWTDAPDAAPLPSPSPNIEGSVPGIHVEFQNVSFSYAGDRPVLKEVSLEALPGATIALVGPTGSGKTSITNLISKMYPHQEGEILLDGVKVEAIQSDSLHQQMGIVQQQNFLFEGTVLDNIRFARPEADEETVREVIRQMDFYDLIERLPLGLQTQVGEGGSNLSAGERQLVSFARALLVKPRLLILDEATSAMDALTEAKIQRALETLLVGRTSFVVAHRLSTIRKADLILVLDGGRIVERGTHSQLLAKSGLYSRLHSRFARSQ